MAPPPPVPTFKVVSGSCTVKDQCVYSDNFGPAVPGRPGQKYSNFQDCVIKQTVPFTLNVRSFDVEDHGSCSYDFLKVNGAAYCGSIPGPHGVTPAAGSELVWHTDWGVTLAGFKICAPRAGYPDTFGAGDASGAGDDWGDDGIGVGDGSG